MPRTERHKPRVIMLGPLPPPTGGMASVVKNLYDSKLSHRCRLTVLNNGKTTAVNRSMLEGIIAQLRLIMRLVNTIRREKVELVHIHTCSGFTFWRDCVHMLISKLFGCKIVWHIHGGYFDRFISTLDFFRKTILRTCLGMGASVIVLSREWQDKLQPNAPAIRWRVVPNGVNVPQDIDKAVNETTCFLFLGNLGEAKGVYDLVEATAKARRNGFRGVVNLAGPETVLGERSKLEKVIHRLECEDQVRLLGVISGRKKHESLAEADCLVLSSHSEGLPMSILEGMAYGLPVIATKVGAIPELITDGKEGFLIAPKDIDALADRLIKLDRDPNMRRDMGKAARRRIMEYYTLEAMIDRLMMVYREVLNTGGGLAAVS